MAGYTTTYASPYEAEDPGGVVECAVAPAGVALVTASLFVSSDKELSGSTAGTGFTTGETVFEQPTLYSSVGRGVAGATLTIEGAFSPILIGASAGVATVAGVTSYASNPAGAATVTATLSTAEGLQALGTLETTTAHDASIVYHGYLDGTDLYEGIAQAVVYAGGQMSGKVYADLYTQGTVTDNVQLRIRETLAEFPEVAHSEWVDGSGIGGHPGSTVEFTFLNPPLLEADTIYYFELVRDGGLDETNHYLWWGYYRAAGSPTSQQQAGAYLYTRLLGVWSRIADQPYSYTNTLRIEYTPGGPRGTSNVAGRLHTNQELAATPAGVALVVTGLAITRPLVGSAVGGSTVSGDLTAADLVSTVGAATVAATLKLTYPLTGSSAGVGAVTGTASSIKEMTATVAGAAAVTGSIFQVHELAGVSDGVTLYEETTGLLDVIGVNDPTSTTDGAATVTGYLGVEPTGITAGTSTVIGSLDFGNLLSVAAGTSTTNGALTAIGATLNIVVASDGVSAVTAALTVIDLIDDLVGASSGSGTATSGAAAGFVSESWMTLLYRQMPREVSPNLTVPYSTMKVSRSTSPSPIGRCGNISIQSVVRPPRSSTPCVEPVTYGSNVLADGGFESQLADWGGGSSGAELPYPAAGWNYPYKFTDPTWDNGSTTSGTYWYRHDWPGSTGSDWRVTSNNVLSGSYSARVKWVQDADFPAFFDSNTRYLTPVGVAPVRCRVATAHSVSAYVNPGDPVELAAHVMVDSHAGAPLYPNVTIDISFYDVGGGEVGAPSNQYTWFLTSNYTRYALPATAPVSAHYCIAHLYFGMSGAGPLTYDYDFYTYVDAVALSVT